MSKLRDYRAWHRDYDNPDSPLSQRLKTVQRRLSELLTAAPAGPINLISMCAGQGRDVIGVLPHHPRGADVRAVLVELDPENVEFARASAANADLKQVDIIEADASMSDVYAPNIPADIVLACGILGNVSDADVERTTRNVSMLCAPNAALIWTRARQEPDVNPQIRRWLEASGFEVLSFDALESAKLLGVGTARLTSPPIQFEAGFRFFTFIR